MTSHDLSKRTLLGGVANTVCALAAIVPAVSLASPPTIILDSTVKTSTLNAFDRPLVAISADGGRAATVWLEDDGNGVYGVKSNWTNIVGYSATWQGISGMSPDGLYAQNSRLALSEDGAHGISVWKQNDYVGTDENSDPIYREFVYSKSVTYSGTNEVWGAPVKVNANNGCPGTISDLNSVISSDGSKAVTSWA